MDKWANVDALMARKGLVETEIPDHAFTREEFQERFGLSRPGAEHRLRSAIESGEILCGVKKVSRGRSFYWMNFYWVPEPAPKKRSKAA